MTRFDDAFKAVIGEEGGYVNDPRDPGGETKWGISKASYPHLNIAALTLDDAKTIYRRDYWNAVQADSLGAPLDQLAFDAAVNQGVGAAKTLLLSARTPAAFLSQRLLNYTDFLHWAVYGRGWTKRLARQIALLDDHPTRVFLSEHGSTFREVTGQRFTVTGTVTVNLTGANFYIRSE